MDAPLTEAERKLLITIARQALEDAACGRKLTRLKMESLPDALRRVGASFVTLTRKGLLRGCIGALEPYQSLVDDVREHAVAAALNDYRFQTVSAAELEGIEIEISRLTMPAVLDYKNADDLLAKLRPGTAGVILKDGPYRRATFLPQVWEKIPDKAEFLDNLCYKMGSPPDSWRKKRLDVLVYQVEEFHE